MTEIHDTNRQQGEPAVCERKSEGAMGENVYGTYVHGIFDSMDVVNAVVRALAERNGIDPEGLAGLIMRPIRNSNMTRWQRSCASIWIWKQSTGSWKQAYKSIQ